MRDIVSKHGTIRNALTSGTIAANNANTTINGTSINDANYNGVMFYLIPGTWTDGTHTFTIQEADDNGSGSPSSFGNVAATDLVTWQATSASSFIPVKATDASGLPTGNIQPQAISSAATNIYQRVGYIGNKQWVRISVTSSGVSSGASYEVIVELGEPRQMPANV